MEKNNCMIINKISPNITWAKKDKPRIVLSLKAI